MSAFERTAHRPALGVGARCLLLCLLLCLPGCRHTGAATDEKKEPDVHVRARPAAKQTIAETVTGLGRCEALPDQFAVLTAAAEGRVIRLLKQPGDSVGAGAAVVELDSTLADKEPEGKGSGLRFSEGLPRCAAIAAAKRGANQRQAGHRTGPGGGRQSPIQREPFAALA